MQRDNAKHWLFAAALVAAVFLAYQPAWQGGISLGRRRPRDPARSALGAGPLRASGSIAGATQQYYPLLHSVFWVEHRLWGDWTLPYHLVNILLHATAALMVALVLRRLAIPGAYLAAAIFALHPVQVESVAWITELKNTLSAVFYLGAAIAYLRFDEERSEPMYRWALVLFVLGLLSKTVTATLPAALLVVFWWRRGRLSWQRDVRPLLPFFALGAAAGVFTAWVERTLIGAKGAAFDLTLVERGLIAGRAVWFYLGNLFWPANLVFIYPRWNVSQTVWWQYLYPAAALLLAVVLWRLRGRWRGPLAGLLFFAGTLFPVLGFCNVFPFIYSFVADHFQYLASLGIIVPMSAGAALGLERLGLWRRPGGYVLCLGLLAVLAGLTFRQCRMYHDVETLYRTTIERNPACWMAYNNLGNLLAERGETKAAMELFRNALKLRPDYPEGHNDLGIVLVQQGRIGEGIAHFREAIRLNPKYASKGHYNLGRALAMQGCVDEALAEIQESLKQDPNYADARQWLRNVQAQKDKNVGRIGRAARIAPLKPRQRCPVERYGLAAGDRPERLGPRRGGGSGPCRAGGSTLRRPGGGNARRPGRGLRRGGTVF